MNNDGRIVVGIDGSDGGRRALAWAVDEAARSGAVVTAVVAWQWDGVEVLAPAPLSPAEARAAAARLGAEEVAAAITSRGTVPPVTLEIAEGRPGRVLATIATGARLLVLGSHGHSRLYHAVLGSVTEEAVRAATCPVVVVPAPHEERPAAARNTGVTVGAAG